MQTLKLLEMNNISIEFPGVKALNNVNFMAKAGKVQAIVGANGAGKSTLMKVLSGAYSHYTGHICVEGNKENIKSPVEAKRLGIQVVYQEVDIALVPNLTVAENILLDSIVSNRENKLFFSWKELHARAEEVLKRLNINLSTKKYANELTLSQKQMVLIARAIAEQCKLLILDEPTAPLSFAETEELFRVVREVKADNVGVIFISHRLPELFQICDNVTVMRDGEIVAVHDISETSQNMVVEQMLGRKFEDTFPNRTRVHRPKVLDVVDLCDTNKLKNVHIHVEQGEIIGIAGLVGAGKTELCKALFGLTELTKGYIEIDGRKLKLKSPCQAVKRGIALIPEERRKEGMLGEESIAINISAVNLHRFSKLGGFLNFKAEKAAAKKVISSLDIKTPDENRKVALLSGGNQQKVVIGKWIDTDARVFIFDEPTKGVDIGAKKDIFQLINRLSKEGKAIIYASCELSEIIGITDRVYVIYDGEIVKELNTASTTEEELLYYSTGGK